MIGGQAGRLRGQVLLLAQVGGAGRRGPELGDRVLPVAGLLQQVGAHGVQPVVVAEALAEAVEQREAGLRPAGHCRGHGPVEPHHRVAGHRLKPGVEGEDPGPVGVSVPPGLVNVSLRDVQYLVDVGLLLLFWMTPIVYDWTKVHDKLVVNHGLDWLFNLYIANPVCACVLSFQRVLWPGGDTEKGAPFVFQGDLYTRLGVTLAVSLVLLWLAQRVFARMQGNFAQEL